MSEDSGTGTARGPQEHGPRVPLCAEPWKRYYILRRGILPCCHGVTVIAPMSAWRVTWNSDAMQEIRSYLARGELSPYCLQSLSCPIVQRHLSEDRLHTLVTSFLSPASPPAALRLLNRLLFRVPGKIYGRITRKRPR